MNTSSDINSRNWLPAVTRYGLATLGPLSVSAAHFGSALVLLRLMKAQDFGLIAFMLTVVQFAFGLSNALLGAPLAVAANRSEVTAVPLFFKANLIFSVLAATCGGIFAWVLGYSDVAAATGMFVGVAVMRWFFRSYLYAIHRPAKAAVGDVIYAASLISCLGVAWAAGLSVNSVMIAYLVASLTAFLASGNACLKQQFHTCLSQRMRDYGDVWRVKSRWALLGVISTEATVNAPAWLVSVVYGPAAFAPLAAAALFFRPVALVCSSLTQLERPRMAKALAMGSSQNAMQIAKDFRLVAVATWVVSAIAALVVVRWLPSLLPEYGHAARVLVLAAATQAAVALIQAWRTPDGALLQAGDAFAPLARATVSSAIVGVIGSVLMLWLTDEPVYSMVAVVVAQLVAALLISRLIKHLVFRT